MRLVRRRSPTSEPNPRQQPDGQARVEFGVNHLMSTLAWGCLFIPLAGVVLLTLAGSRISRTTAAWTGTVFAFASFACAVGAFVQMLGEGASHRAHVFTLYTWAGSATFKVPLAVLVDPLSVTEMLIVAGVGAVIVMYCDRVRARRPQGAPLLRLPRPVPVLDAAPGHGRELRAAPGRMGPRRPLVLSPDRVLARASRAGRRRQEGVRDERRRRRRHRDRDLLHGARPGHDRLHDGLPHRLAALGEGVGRRQLGRGRTAARRRRQVGPDPAAHVASRTRWRARRRCRR